MRSFRLDRGSIADFFDSWPALGAGAVLAGLFVYFGMSQTWARIAGLVVGGVYGGYLLRGVAAKRLEEKYPGARWMGLLMVGLTSATLGVATRMAFPSVQGSSFDLTWLGISFFSILTFVIANRKNPNVMR